MEIRLTLYFKIRSFNIFFAFDTSVLAGSDRYLPKKSFYDIMYNMLPEEIGYINEGTKEERLAHLADIIANEDQKPEVLSQYSNNHIHTTFSFSPYSPSAAVCL